MNKKSISSYSLAGLMGYAGVTHFNKPKGYDHIVPEYIPLNPRTVTYASGVVELAIAGGLIFKPTRKITGVATAAFLAAVFPANIEHWRKVHANPKSSEKMKKITTIRLPLQIPLILWALKIGLSDE